ncbi:MAG TPA: biotin carboxylase N-terminal domain-containing protein [Thermomicrobiales bacterium]|nr:biotin carboxylase N-terminal domain-containing protein [Thermomicrobiales bacterium]
MPFGPILAIANRGEIAIRIARTARRLGWQPVVLLGAPDIRSYAAREVGSYELVGPAGSELDPALVVAAALRAGATALHPGYGFLSERPDLSQACIDAGITFIGPSPETLALCGDKIATRHAAERAGVPTLPASEPLTLQDEAAWADAADRIGYPLIAKVTSGGGGRGLRVAQSASATDEAIRSALREAGASAAGTTLYLERFVEGARHVEVQVAGDGTGAVALGDRDCSIQRRHQKVVEEAPAFGLSDALRRDLHAYAVAMAREVSLLGVGTVEFLLSRDSELFFIEINPRLQVEHTVTEEVTGLDLVEVQLRLAEGGSPPEPKAPRGHAIQARLYAEDPLHGFAPSPGEIRLLEWPRLPGLRVDAGYQSGDVVPTFYDAMVGKLIVHAPDRTAAIARMADACDELLIGGIATNRAWLRELMRLDAFQNAQHTLATAESVEVVREPTDSLARLATALLPDGADGTAWSSSGPFRVVAPATLALHDPGGAWDARVRYVRERSDWQPSVNGGTNAADETTSVIIDTDDGYEVSDASGRWLVRIGPIPRQHADAETTDGALRAPMPGTVVAVNVAAGQAVSAGEVLAVMTAMKMEMTLAAPFDGVVASVGCAVGDLVSSRQVLVTVTKQAESEAQDG